MWTTWDEHGGENILGTLGYNGFFPLEVSVNFDCFFQILGWAKVHPIYFFNHVTLVLVRQSFLQRQGTILYV